MKIFVISLVRSQARRQHISETMSALKLDYEFFDAIDGKLGLPDDLEKLQDDRHRIIFRSRPLAPGEKGCYASHYRLWQKCIELNEPIVVIEDDFIPSDNIKTSLNHIKEIAANFDYIRIQDQVGEFTPLAQLQELQLGFWKDNSKGTVGYIISPSGAKKLLLASDKWQCSVDNFIYESYHHNVASLGIYPPLLKASFEWGTEIHHQEKTKVPVYYKLTRELHRFYRFIRIELKNRQLKKNINLVLHEHNSNLTKL